MAVGLLCFLYSPSSLKTLSEVSIVVVLLILLLAWATGCICGLPRLGVIWISWLCLLSSASLFSKLSMSGFVLVASLSSSDMITIGEALITKIDVDYSSSLHLILIHCWLFRKGCWHWFELDACASYTVKSVLHGLFRK